MRSIMSFDFTNWPSHLTGVQTKSYNGSSITSKSIKCLKARSRIQVDG